MRYQLRMRRDQYQGQRWKKGALRRSKSPLTLNLAPMIDVTFLLLIFFSVTTTFKRAEGYFAAKLPKDAGQTTVALPISPVIVRVQQFGKGPGDYRLKLDNFLNTPATFDELTDFLLNVQKNPGFDEKTPVVIAAEPDVAWDHVVSCWNAAVRAGCVNISFGK
ncbi:MAG: biopolymer transporter ExbD [Phycisphaerales bacterium]|nr:biopolymer transporter ExbD [Phycisphaerales bacterium]